MRAILILLGLLGLMAAGMTAAQPMPNFSGATLDSRPYELALRNGRVVMVVLWRTDCAVCLSKMPELRANAQGWKSAPFDLLLINLDPSPADAEAYDRTRRQVAGQDGPVWSFWHGHVQMPPDWRLGGRLPRTLVFDRPGRLAARHDGRHADEVWDQVADLLP